MKVYKKILTTLLLAILTCSSLMSQSSISGSDLNEYTSIEEFVFLDGSLVPNAVKVSDTIGFDKGDTVMVYIPKGFRISEAIEPGEIFGYYGYTGKYSILIIDSIAADKTIAFNAPAGFEFATSKPRQLRTGEVGQLIKVATFDNAVVTGTLRAKAWDPITNTGGVLVLYIKETLTLEAPIDVSGQGFRGADPSGDIYGGGCYSEDPTGLQKYFYNEDEMGKAGLKGEGAIDTSFHKMRGISYAVNAGGGGNAKYSGGGGGSNYNVGNSGGIESNVCVDTPAPPDSVRGMGGLKFGDFLYENDDWTTTDDDLEANRVFMGGGGGTGTQDPGFEASAGGNGGGIVIIIADTLKSVLGHPILAEGDSVTTLATGAGGGGGGGGAILLDVSHYEGNIDLSAKGGGGGSTFHSTNYTGPGGGGGGGIYWMRYDSTNVLKNTRKSGGGTSQGLPTNPGDDGLQAGTLAGLNVPLNGFLFNTLPHDKIVCSDETPLPINASRPKGGNGHYQYQWEYQPDTAAPTTWYSNPVDTLEDYYFKEPLTVTTKYRRIVSSSGLTEGDDVFITYTVLPRILGNTVLASDTVCFGLEAIPFEQHPDSIIRGANIGAADSTVRWIKSTDGGSIWSDATGNNSYEGYAPPGLTETTIYTRVIKSGVCDDTSNQVIVTVLPAVENHTIDQDTIICYNQTPDILTGAKPAGGDPALFSYKWEMANNLAGPYTEVASTQNYSPPALTAPNYYYRRIFYSGIDDACKDTTEVLTIEVLPLINNNEMITPEDTVCENDALPELGAEAEQATGGDGSYTYIWQVSDNQLAWGDSATFTANDPFNLSAFPAKRYIRRLVISGADDVCQDISDTLTVNVIPSVNNNSLISTDITICQDIEMPILTANTVAGGDGTYGTLWLTSTDGSSFIPASGTNDSPNSYAPGALLSTTWFVREVWSADDSRKVCDTRSDTLLATVKPRIAENYLNDKDLTDSICYDTDLAVIGSDQTSSPALTGGDGAGSYSFHWEKSPTPNEPDFVDASVSTSNFFEASATNLQYLRRIVTSSVCADTSEVLEVFIRQLPTGVLALNDGQDIVVCESDLIPVELKVDLTGELDVTSYFIQVTHTSEEGTDDINTDNITSNPGIIEHYPFTDDSATYVYTLKAIVDNNGCVAPLADMSGSGSVKVYQTPESEIMPVDPEVCGPLVSLEAVADRGGVGHWIKNSGNVDAAFTAVDNEFTDVTISQLENESEMMQYGWVLATPRCSDTAFVSITHYQDPAHPPYFPADTVKMFFAKEYLLVANEPTAGGGVWTVADGSFGSVAEGSTEPETLASELELNAANTFVWTVSNPAIAGSEVCGPYSDELTIVRMDVTQYDGFSPNGDDWNQYYVMRGLSKADDFTFTVFNNWGTQIKTVTKEDAEMMGRISQGSGAFAVEDELILWDGTAADNVTIVPDGAYYYHIQLRVGEESYNKKGSILVKSRK